MNDIINAVNDCVVFHGEYFDKYMMVNGEEQDALCQVHEVLEHVLKICPKFVPFYHIERNLIVLQDSLREVYRCHSDFGFIYDFLDMTRPQMKGLEMQLAYQRMEFFLRCAKRLEFPVDFTIHTPDMKILASRARDDPSEREVVVRHVYFIDVPMPSLRDHTPLFLACQAGNLRAVRMLLRFGADPDALGSRFCIEGNHFHKPLFEVVSRLNSNYGWQLETLARPRTDAMRQHYSELQAEEEQYLEVLRLLAAAVRLPLRFTVDTGSRSDDTEEVSRLHMRYRNRAELHSDIMLPRLSKMCRWTILKQLRLTRNLPDGLHRLPLPKLLIRFLNLDM